jgi:hypothetical protein
MNLRTYIASVFSRSPRSAANPGQTAEEQLRAERAQADTLAAQVEELTGENRELRARLRNMSFDLEQAREAAARPDEEISRQAATRANEIALRMGAPPIRAEDHTADSNDVAGGSLIEQYLALNQKNPAAAAAFAAKHGGASGMLR